MRRDTMAINIKATNKATGEIVDLPVDTLEQIVDAWRVAQEYVKTAETLKDQLKKLVPKYISDKGTSEPMSGYMFRSSPIQRMNYDKSVLRQVVKDEDLLDTFLKPDKTTIDKYLKENLPEFSTELRKSMIAEGRPYQVIKLEKLSRED